MARRSKKQRRKTKAIDRRLEVETVISIARDLARERDKSVIVSEQARLRAEMMARRGLSAP